MAEDELLKMKLGDLVDYSKGSDILTLVYQNRLNTILSKIYYHQAETGIDIKAEFDSREIGDKLNYLNGVLEQVGVPPELRKEMLPEVFRTFALKEPPQPTYSTAEIPRNLTKIKKTL